MRFSFLIGLLVILCISNTGFTQATETITAAQADELRLKAEALYDKQRYAQCIALYNRLIQCQPLAEDYVFRGCAELGLGQQKLGLADFTSAIQLDPYLATGYANRAGVYNDLGLYTQALSDAATAITLSPKLPLGYLNRGNAEFHMGKLDEAVTDYSECLRLDSSDYHGHRNRGQVLCLQKKYEKAIPDLSFAINAVPTDSRSYGFRSEAYAALKQYGHAISDLIALAKLDPAQRKEACNIIMSLCAMKEKYDVAVTAFTKIIAAVPDCVSAYQNRGVCYRRLGKGELADADIAKAKILEATPKSNASPNTTPELHD